MAGNYSVYYSFLVNNSDFVMKTKEMQQKLKEFQSDVKNFGKQLTMRKVPMADLMGLKNKSLRAIRQEMNEISKQTFFTPLNNQLKQFNDELRNTGKNLMDFGKRGLMSFTLPAVLIGASSIKAYSEMEQMELAFGRAFGKSRDKMLEKGKKFARETALTVKQVSSMMTSFKFAGMSENAIMPSVHNIATAIFGSGAGKEFGNIMRQVNDAMGRGYIEAREIRLIQANGLKDFANKIAEVKGMSTSKLMEAMSSPGGSRMVSRSDIILAFQAYANDPRFKTTLADYVKSMEGSKTLLESSLFETRSAIGELLVKGLNLPEKFGAISNILLSFNQKISALSPEMKKFIAVSLGIAVLIPPLAIVAGLVAKLAFVVKSGAKSFWEFGRMVRGSEVGLMKWSDILRLSGDRAIEARTRISWLGLGFGALNVAMFASEVAAKDWGAIWQNIKTEGFFSTLLNNLDLVLLAIQGIVAAQWAWNAAKAVGILMLTNPALAVGLVTAAVAGGAIYGASKLFGEGGRYEEFNPFKDKSKMSAGQMSYPVEGFNNKLSSSGVQSVVEASREKEVTKTSVELILHNNIFPDDSKRNNTTLEGDTALGAIRKAYSNIGYANVVK